ncbi:MAG: metallophosphoesterase [Acidobacteriota bacterium]
MRIAILSDTHDQIWKTRQAVAQMLQGGAEVVLHCGDLCSPFMIRHLAEALGDRPLHLVWGNNEGDPRMITQVASAYPNVHLHGALARLELGGVRIAVNHYPEIAEPLALSGCFDLVCYGHDHTAYAGRRGDCVLLNPGEILGMNGRSTFAWFDTVAREARHEEVTT